MKYDTLHSISRFCRVSKNAKPTSTTWVVILRVPVEVALSGASLRGAVLTQANLVGANLMSADLSGADLRRASVERQQLKTARIERNTLLPTEHKWMQPARLHPVKK